MFRKTNEFVRINLNIYTENERLWIARWRHKFAINSLVGFPFIFLSIKQAGRSHTNKLRCEERLVKKEEVNIKSIKSEQDESSQDIKKILRFPNTNL